MGIRKVNMLISIFFLTPTFLLLTIGSYGYMDAYGIYRKVDYVADKYGFRLVTLRNNSVNSSFNLTI